jgi:hypothetical protein
MTKSSAALTAPTLPATTSSSSLALAPSTSAGTIPPTHTAYSLSSFQFRHAIDEVLDLHKGSYSSWRERVELQLAIFRILDHLDDGAAAPPGDDEWLLIDKQMWLYGVITPELRAMVSSPSASARDIWAAIENVFHNNTLARAINLSDELHRQRQGEQSVASFCARIKSINDNLRDIGHALSTPALLLVLICDLYGRHRMTAKMIQRDSATLDFSATQNMLILDEQQELPSDNVEERPVRKRPPAGHMDWSTDAGSLPFKEAERRARREESGLGRSGTKIIIGIVGMQELTYVHPQERAW